MRASFEFIPIGTRGASRRIMVVRVVRLAKDAAKKAAIKSLELKKDSSPKAAQECA